ncbi:MULTISPECIES: hypothetical protein [unclassified Ruegeria]|uniref:hypothetical protein n=1 Tax=unclassified Ruegeria TaxID=2625375 RepID=UPI001488A2F4|nr:MULTISPECIES: hypothetical protein [unclassified Ruegeria]
MKTTPGTAGFQTRRSLVDFAELKAEKSKSPQPLINSRKAAFVAHSSNKCQHELSAPLLRQRVVAEFNLANLPYDGIITRYD